MAQVPNLFWTVSCFGRREESAKTIEKILSGKTPESKLLKIGHACQVGGEDFFPRMLPEDSKFDKATHCMATV